MSTNSPIDTVVFCVKNTSSEFPYSWDLTMWDWFSCLIAIFSLLIAGFALWVAQRTLSSQKKTERNTQPIITREAQQLLFCYIIFNFFQNKAVIHSLRILKNFDEKLNPEVYVISKMAIKEQYVHEELHFSNHTYFNLICLIKEKIQSYNLYIDSVIRFYSEKGISIHNLDMIELLSDEALRSIFTMYPKSENDILYRRLREWIESTVEYWRKEKGAVIEIPKDVTFNTIDSLGETIYEKDNYVEYFNDINTGALYYYKNYTRPKSSKTNRRKDKK